MTDNIDAIIFSRRLRTIVYDRGLSTEYLAYKTGTTKAAVYKWLEGYHMPNLSSLYKLRGALGVTWGELLGEV